MIHWTNWMKLRVECSVYFPLVFHDNDHGVSKVAEEGETPCVKKTTGWEEEGHTKKLFVPSENLDHTRGGGSIHPEKPGKVSVRAHTHAREIETLARTHTCMPPIRNVLAQIGRWSESGRREWKKAGRRLFMTA